jgi:hypothetical protein
MMFIPVANLSEDRGWPEDANAAKGLFMIEVSRIVEEGRGELARLESGTLELRLSTGETYQLGEQSITRIA